MKKLNTANGLFQCNELSADEWCIIREVWLPTLFVISLVLMRVFEERLFLKKQNGKNLDWILLWR
jgi:hypothetical protein